MESACQRARVACGCCCGIHNLELDVAAREDLMRARLRNFARVDLERSESIRAYRREQEERESSIGRRNSEIYACPFYSYLDRIPENDFEKPSRVGRADRAGCLIHPARTGDPDSQKYSFYGAAICRDYDCRNKERDDGGYASLLAENFGNEEYGRLMADGEFYSALEKVPGFPASLKSGPARDSFLELARARLRSEASLGMTSFEIKYRYYEDPARELDELTGGLVPEATRRLLASCPLPGDAPPKDTANGGPS